MLKNLQRCFANVLQMFYFTCNHGVNRLVLLSRWVPFISTFPWLRQLARLAPLIVLKLIVARSECCVVWMRYCAVLCIQLAAPDRLYLRHDLVVIPSRKDQQYCLWLFSDLALISCVKRKQTSVSRRTSILLYAVHCRLCPSVVRPCTVVLRTAYRCRVTLRTDAVIINK